MKQRSHIKSQIVQAWTECIEDDYCSQRINSERSLQASLWSHLNKLLPRNRRLFIEPNITIQTTDDINKLVPDIVICNAREVISVIELKYLPRALPKYNKDIQSLSLISENRDRIAITHDRFRGYKRDSNIFSFSKNILFVWAGVHAEEKQENQVLYSKGIKSLENCYMQLHAETAHNKSPRVYQRK